MAGYREYIVGLLVAASALIALYVNLYLGMDTLYSHIFYLPVVLAAVWYTWKSVYIALFLGAMHVLLGWYAAGIFLPDTLIRAATLLVVSLLLSYLSSASGRLAEHLRKSSDEELQAIFNGVTEAMFIFDPDGKAIEVNHRVQETCLISRDQALARSFLDYCVDAPGEKVLLHWERARSGEDQVFECTFRRPGDSTAFPAEVGLRRVQLRGRDAVLASVRDISRAREAEAELSEARKQAELYVDLMGHDINNLNQVGIGYLEIALDTLDCDEEGKYLLQRPLESMQRSSKLIDNVRLIQCLETPDRKKEAVDLDRLLAEVAGEFSLKAEYPGFPGRHVTVDYAPVSGCIIQASPEIKEAFSNLLASIVERSPGPVAIRLTLQTIVEAGKPYYRIGIEDDGPGLSDLRKLKLFSRAAPGQARIRGGGLGLFPARALIEDADGSVTVEDRVRGDYTQGSRFVVILPACCTASRIV